MAHKCSGVVDCGMGEGRRWLYASTPKIALPDGYVKQQLLRGTRTIDKSRTIRNLNNVGSLCEHAKTGLTDGRMTQWPPTRTRTVDKSRTIRDLDNVGDSYM